DKRFKALTAEKRHAQELLEENLPLLREDVLYQLLNREDSEEAALLERMERCGVIFLKNAWYSAVILAIHGFDQLSRDEDTDTALLLEMEAIRDAVSRFACCAIEFIRTQQDGKLVILISMGGPDRARAAALLKEAQDAIFRRVSLDTAAEITVAAGNPCDELRLVWQSYKEASAAYRYRAIAGSHGVIYADRLPAVSALSLERFTKLERALFDALKRSDEAALTERMEALFEHIQSQLPVSYTPAFVSVQLFNDTMNLLQELSIDSSLIFPDLDELFAQVLTLRTPEQPRRFFAELYGAILGYISLLKQEGRGDVRKAILAFLDKNYRNEEIGLDLLATELHFSVSYLVKVFKKATGKSIKEYITEKRISHAKELLGGGSVKVNDAARQVGYPNVRSFINIFKKHTGLTPGEYMNLALRGKG
ncbi:MAG: helix-turn-helix domain-containing protein, partial [Eubacteriales bacterium]|nr:helix-turn-helix domain-containing protein [Eubacteriales bacterium]